MNKISFNNQKLINTLAKIWQHILLIFIGFVIIIYSYLGVKIFSGLHSSPSLDTLNQQADSSKTIHIDKDSINKLQALQDNSVNVQALFNDARNNPF